jgi:hypothetical protein
VVGYLDHRLVDADVRVGLEVDAVVLLQRSHRPHPHGRGTIGGGWGGRGEAAREGAVALL